MSRTSPTIDAAAPRPRPRAGEPGHAASDGRAYYRPHLDGLRAVAVYLVLLFHAGYARFSGGYIGVDVFFVLSGYLVTQVLLRDLAALDRIRFSRFYARRYRRLLPAAFVALLVTATVYVAIASPSDAISAVNAFKAAFVYAANWFFVHRSTAYFGGNIAQNPVLHFWSLAVEEQFYLVWPLALAGLFALSARLRVGRVRFVQAVVAGAALASLVAALSLRTSSPTHAYYGTDTRAYQLLAGALVALAPGMVERAARRRTLVRILTPVALAVLVFLATSWVHLDAIERGSSVMLASVGVIVGLEAGDRGLVKRALSNDSVVYLGRVSYGTYLWHWPVILVMTTLLHLSTLTTVALAALVATSLASLSYELLERPIRLSRFLDGHRRAVIAAGLAVSLVSALVIVPSILQPDASSAHVLQGRTSGFTPVPAGLDWANAAYTALPPLPDCYRRSPDACIVVHGTAGTVLLMGDSHARMLLPAFTEIARKDHLTLGVSSLGGCPWQRHLYTPIAAPQCRQRKEDAYERVIPALHPDVIVAVNFGYDNPSVPAFAVTDEHGRNYVRSGPGFAALMERTTRASADELLADTHSLVLIEPIPRAIQDPTACLRRAKYLEQCRYVSPVKPSKLEQLYRTLAAGNPRILSADLDRVVCPFLPICDPVIAGRIVKVDRDHLTKDFSLYIAPQIEEYLRANGLVGR